MSVKVMRQGAKVLRERATEANASHDPENEEPWFTVPDEKSIRTKWVTFAEVYDVEAPYIVMMCPGVGLTLADVLEEAAETWEVLTPGLGDPSKDPLLAELAKLAQLIVNGAGT